MIRKHLVPFMQTLTRRKRPVSFDDLSRDQPVSRMFGMDRGQAIDRYYIESFIDAQSSLIRGRVLEVASNEYSRRYHRGARSFDVLHVDPRHPEATLIGDLTRMETLPEARFDAFVCTQTFNFVLEIAAAIAGAHRLLAPSGTLIATLAGLTQISRYDMDRWGDYWRFTSASAMKLFGAHFAQVKVQTFGNVLAAKAIVDGLAVEDLPSPELLDSVDPDYQVVIGVVATK
jgi:hypothetical protein